MQTLVVMGIALTTYISIALLALVIILTAIWLWLKPQWMGLKDRTLWDWMTVFALPVFATLIGSYLGMIQQALQQSRSEELMIQQYIDRISTYYVETQPTAEAVAVARAQTRAVLRLVSQDRAGHVLAFLGDLGALQSIRPNMEFLDLSGAEFKDLDLEGIDFEGSDLRAAEFEGANLQGADFEQANLIRADFKNADLRTASFEEATLSSADFDHADLRGSNLTGATGLRSAQLLEACLDANTILPTGLNITPDQSKGCTGSADDD